MDTGDGDYEVDTKITYAGWRITYAEADGWASHRDADDVKAQLPWKNKCAVWPEGELAVRIAVSGETAFKIRTTGFSRVCLT